MRSNVDVSASTWIRYETFFLSLPITDSPCEAVEELPLDTRLLRRVRDNPSHREEDKNSGRWRVVIGSNALQLNDDWSAYWEQHLHDRHGLGVDAVATEKEPLIFVIGLDDLLEIVEESVSLVAWHSPDGAIPIECGHCSVAPSDVTAWTSSKLLRRTIRNKMSDRLMLCLGNPIATS